MFNCILLLMHGFYYLRGALGDAALLTAHKAAVQRLLSDDYTSKNFEKLKGHDVYSFRLGDRERLLFTIVPRAGHDYLLVLDYLPTHDYDGSRFLKNPRVLEQYIERTDGTHQGLIAQNGAAAEEGLPFEPASDAFIARMTSARPDATATSAPASVPMEHYQGKHIVLNNAQSEALSAPLPALISGIAGSGKTTLVPPLLTQFVDAVVCDAAAFEHASRVIYITSQQKLVDHVRDVWQDCPAAYDKRCRVDILTYKAYLQEVLGENFTAWADKDAFISWYEAYTEKQKNMAKAKRTPLKKPLDPSIIYQEFKICSGYDKAAYLKLGQRESLVDKSLRGTIYDAYQDYINSLKGTIDPNFHELLPGDMDEAVRADRLIVDEAQDFSYGVIKNLELLARNRALVLSMDTHQSLHDKLSMRPYLLKTLRISDTSHIKLKTTFRCPFYIVQAANSIMAKKNRLLGRIADKDELAQIDAIAPDDTMGEVYVLTLNNLKDSAWLAAAQKRTQFAVVTPEEHLAAAKAYFDTPLVFTPETIKGLEYQEILGFRLFDTPLFDAANRALRLKADKTHPHRPKQGDGDVRFGPEFNQVYVAYTRAQKKLVIVEETFGWHNQQLIKPLQAIAHKGVPKPDTLESVSTPDDWLHEAEKLYHAGQTALAKHICESKLHLDFDVFEARFKPQVAPEANLTLSACAASTKNRTSTSRAAEEPPPVVEPTPPKKPIRTKPQDAPKARSQETVVAQSLFQQCDARMFKMVTADLNFKALFLETHRTPKDEPFVLLAFIEQDKTRSDLFIGHMVNDYKMLQKMTTATFKSYFKSKTKKKGRRPAPTPFRSMLQELIALQALFHHHLEMAVSYVESGSTLLWAVSHDANQLIDALLRIPQLDLNKARLDGTTALHLAIKNKNLTLVKQFLAMGWRLHITEILYDGGISPPHAVLTQQGERALQLAIESGQLNIVKWLLANRPPEIPGEPSFKVHWHTVTLNRLDPIAFAKQAGLPKIVNFLESLLRPSMQAEAACVDCARAALKLQRQLTRKTLHWALTQYALNPLLTQQYQDETGKPFVLLDTILADEAKSQLFFECLLNDFTIFQKMTPDVFTVYLAAYKGPRRDILLALVNVGIQFHATLSDASESLDYYNSFLHCTIRKSLPELAHAFIQLPYVDLNAVASIGLTPLAMAAWYGAPKILQMLLNDTRVDPNTVMSNCMEETIKEPITALYMIAAYTNRPSMLKIFLTHPDIDPNYIAPESKQPVVNAAIMRGHTESIALLLADKRLKVDCSNTLYKSPLILATEQNNLEAVKLLLARDDTDPNTCYFGWSALHTAIARNLNPIIQALLQDRRLNLNLAGSAEHMGRTPLHMAIELNRIPAFKFLTRDLSRIDLTKQDQDGYTPLHLAAKQGNMILVRELLKLATDPKVDIAFDAKTNAGLTAIEVAEKHGYTVVASFLTEATAVLRLRVEPMTSTHGFFSTKQTEDAPSTTPTKHTEAAASY